MNDSTRGPAMRAAQGWLLAVAACFTLAACGGGGSSSADSSPNPPAGEVPPPSAPPAPAPPPDPAPDPTPPPPPPPDPPPPAPPPSPPPETPAAPKSAKRGIAYDLANPSDLAALSPGVSWWYNWALRPANSVPADYRSRYGMDYMPMLWNGNFNDATVETFLKANPSIKFLLLLNEPNLVDQANQTPQQAAQLWPRYEAIAARTGVQLVGPAITWGTLPGFSDPVVWLDAFYAAYRAANAGRDPRIDYIAFHWYDYGLNGQLDRLTRYGKPFWVTEFANWHSGNDGAQIDSVARQKAQMTEMVAVCESRSDVFRYAWFTGRWPDEATRHTSLLAGTGELTELGRHYLDQPYWVSAWGASPQRVSAAFDQQTLRQIVRTTVGGDAVRIRLSNVFGTQPVTVSNVQIARHSGEASVDASTSRALTFGGQPTVTLPPGGEAYSDRIAFNVPAQSDVAVSFYLPNATTITTGQPAGARGTYVTAGNVSGNAKITVTSQTPSYQLLTNVDVQGNTLLGSVATLGASITAGVGASDADQSWPSALAARLSESGLTVGVLNQGISGNSSLVDDAGPSAENRFERDVLRQTGIRWVIYSDEPINDLRRSPQPSSAQLIAPLQRMIAKAHRRQVKFLCSTLTPYEGDPSWSASQETVRQQYNAFVRSKDSGCDGVVDQDRATRDPANPTKYLPLYDSGDHLHPNAAGHRAIAASVDLNLFVAE